MTRETKILIILLLILIFVGSASAEMKTFVREYTYQAGEIDSKISCRIIALEQVKRLLLEEIGTYLESQTEVKNFRLTKDDITMLTAGIVRTEIVEERWDGNNLKFWLKAKITADPSSVVKSIDSLRKDRQQMRELEILRKRSNNLTTEIEQLRKELAVSNPDPAKINQYNSALKKLSASDYMEKGLFLIQEEKKDEAIEAFTTAIERDPSFGKAYSYLGGAAANNKKYHLAIDYANKAIALNPNDELAYFVRSGAYFELRQYKEAIDDLSTVIIIIPKNADAYSARGSVFMEMGNYKMAVKDFSKAIELLPNEGYLYERRAGAYEKLGKYKQVAEDYSNAYLLGSPHRPAGWSRYDYTFNRDFMNEVDTYAKQGKYKKAIDLLSRAIEKEPKNVDIIVKRGDIYAQSGKHRLAVNDYTRAIELKSDNKSAYLYFHRAKSYKVLGEYKQAVSGLKSALDIESSDLKRSTIIKENSYCIEMQKCIPVVNLDPQSLEYCFSIVEASNIAKYCQASVNFLSQIIELKPEFASGAYCERAFIYNREGNNQQAIGDYSKGIDLARHYPQTESRCVRGYSGRAQAYYNSGQYQRAIEDYSKDIEISPRLSSYSYTGRGDVHMKLHNYSIAIRDYTTAIRDYTRVIEKDPGDTWTAMMVINVYSSRGDAYREAGDYQKAVEDYSTAIDLSLKKKPQSIKPSILLRPLPESIPVASPILYFQRGDVHERLGNNQQAVKDYSKVIESNPKDAVSLRKRGNIYAKLGRHKLAVEDLRMAATLGDSDAQDYLKKSEIEW